MRASTPFLSLWAQALRQLRRDLRAGELRLLMLALTLAVAALSAVSFFADRLQAGLSRDAGTLLGGDLVIVSDQPIPAAWVEAATAAGLRHTRMSTFPSMARAPEAQGGNARLVALKAVAPGYPLRGSLGITAMATTVTTASTAPTLSTVQHGPDRGTVWVEAGLLQTLDLKIGDALELGSSRLRIAAILNDEPDRGAGFLSFAPRVMMAEADLAATDLVQPASRISWRLAVIGDSAQADKVARFRHDLEAAIQAQGLRGVRIDSLESGRPEMQQTLDRARLFLHLVAVLSALLASVAVAIAARSFAQRHLDSCALLRVLGQPQRHIAWTYALEFLTVGLLGSLAGVLIGLGLQQVFVELLGRLMLKDLPAPSFGPAGLGLGVGMTLLLAFGLPPILQLAQVPPLRVLRRDLGEPRTASWLVLLAGLGGLAALILIASNDALLGAVSVGGFALAWGLFALAARGLVAALRRWVPEVGAPTWLRLTARQLSARPALVVLQVSSLALGLTALGLLVLLRTDLISSWRAATPVNAPDRFVINILPEQADAFRSTLHAAGVQGEDWAPMIRGRLIALNGKDVRPEDFPGEQARRLVEREFNLSHSPDLPSHNQVSAGQWVAEEADAISVETGLAKTLGLKLGDRLRFDVGGQVIEARITSLRKLDWSSMRVNFFVMFPRRDLPELPATWIAAYRTPAPAASAGSAGSASGPSLDVRLLRAFPNLTSVDVSAQISQVQGIVEQVILAVEVLFLFTLLAGLVVVLATLSATRQARTREMALMRALGARSSLLRQIQRTELLSLGALAGGLAMLTATALSAVLARQVLGFDWLPRPWLPLAGSVGGALLALGAGWLSLREVLRQPVAETLRQATQE
ncbi:ABC transporter permease [Leptothrix ochracea]|uniref:ABC transporter permease n=2 Tax=Leptothrix ochracea TaxID=735331 RepID=UPI0034E2E37F